MMQNIKSYKEIQCIFLTPQVLENRRLLDCHGFVNGVVKAGDWAEGRRHTWLPGLYFFASTWAIITGSIMISKDFYQGRAPEHPLFLVKEQLKGT
jgi:hypothetical protein